MIQVWINKDEAANAAELTVKLNALVKARSGGRALNNDKIWDLLRGLVIFIDESRKAEAVQLATAKQIEHAGLAYAPAKSRDEMLEGHGIPPNAKNVVYVINESLVTAVFQDVTAADFEKVVKAVDAIPKPEEKEKEEKTGEDAPKPFTPAAEP